MVLIGMVKSGVAVRGRGQYRQRFNSTLVRTGVQRAVIFPVLTVTT